MGFILLQFLEIDGQVLSSKGSVLKQMELANKYFMAKWPNPGIDIVTDKTRPSNLWTRAAYYEGLMALYSINEDTTLYNYAVEWGESHQWNPTYGNLDTRDGDHQCCGQTYIELYQISGNADWIGPITENINRMVDDDKNDDWSWVDAIQMSMPVFAKLGVVHEDTSYFDKMYKLYSFSKYQHGENGLYNPEDHLWWRDGNFDPPAFTPDGKNIYWSRGNGWVYTALARVLSVIPENETHREEYISDFLEMSDALTAIQRTDGFWNSSLVDPEHYGGKETSGTGFFVYGMAWGINQGYLDSATYMPYVIAGWEGMVKDALHDNGFLGWVQSTGKEPKDGQPLSYDKPANFEDYGLGAFLLAGSEVYQLAPESGDITSTPDELQQAGNRLFNIYPNPATDMLVINYHIEARSRISVNLLDSKGRIVSSLENQILRNSGDYQISWKAEAENGSKLPKGVFFIHFNSEDSRSVHKVLII